MEEVSQKLLQECSSGCKMAINSIEQVTPHISGDRLAGVIGSYKRKHEEIEKRVDELLHQEGAQGKDPGKAASVFSWISTEMKLKMHDNNSQISKLMMDGCNMGIQSISGYINQYNAASKESMELAKDLVHTEEEFMKELKAFVEE